MIEKFTISGLAQSALSSSTVSIERSRSGVHSQAEPLSETSSSSKSPSRSISGVTVGSTNSPVISTGTNGCPPCGGSPSSGVGVGVGCSTWRLVTGETGRGFGSSAEADPPVSGTSDIISATATSASIKRAERELPVRRRIERAFMSNPPHRSCVPSVGYVPMMDPNGRRSLSEIT